MNWMKEYQQKLILPDQAVKHIKSGNWVDYGLLCGQVRTLDEALAKRKDEFHHRFFVTPIPVKTGSAVIRR